MSQHDKGPSGADLTPKQRRFVEEYLVDFNATGAAIRAGYSAKSASSIGYENLRKPQIQAAIRETRDRLTQRAEITVERVLRELGLLGFSNMADYVRVTPDGDPYVDLSRLTREQFAAVQETTVEDFTEGRGDDARQVRRVRIKLASKDAALEKLGKYLGLFSDTPPPPPGAEITEIRRTIVHPKPPKE